MYWLIFVLIEQSQPIQSVFWHGCP